MKPRIVLSGVNFVEGGPLAVFHDALSCLAAMFSDRYEIIALVHRRELFSVPGVTFLEFPHTKRSWLRRLRFEYVECRTISHNLKPYLWLAMHDMTPDVTAEVRAVYCHNPAPFYTLTFREMLLDRSFTLFGLLYRFLYAIHISKNDLVIVQQEWLRREFKRMFHVRTVVVAHPSLATLPLTDSATKVRAGAYKFLYPAFPRVFKNFELLLNAARLLESRGVSGFEVQITLDGHENSYSSKLRKEFDSLASVKWLGRQTRQQVEALYGDADCLLFPSKLETWGMPISEWKRTGKPMLVADLPYAHETVGSYKEVAFLDPSDAGSLATKMEELIHGNANLPGSQDTVIPAPFANDWEELFRILLAGNEAQASSSTGTVETDEVSARLGS